LFPEDVAWEQADICRVGFPFESLVLTLAETVPFPGTVSLFDKTHVSVL